MVFPKWLVDFYIRCTKETKKSVTKELTKDKKTENYKIPKSLKFPRPITKKEYFGMEVFESPSDGKCDLTILYFHGGAYIHKFSPFHWKFLIEMAKKTGCGLVVPNYLMMPKWTALSSNEVTMRFYEEFATTHDMSKVIIAGDSAGGGLALIVLQRAIKMGLPIPSKAVLLSPWVDVTGGDQSKDKVDNMICYDMVILYGLAWQKGMKNKDPFVSPLYGDMRGLPPVDLWVGENEVLGEDDLLLHQRMVEANVDVTLHHVKKEGHVFPLYPTKNGKQAREEIMEFILK